MKKLNFFNLNLPLFRNCLWVMLAMITTIQMGVAQGCTLSVNGMTNVSLDDDCEALVTTDMIGTTNGGVAPGCPAGDLEITLTTASGFELPDDMITSQYVGQVLEVMVQDMNSGNTSWGNIMVEDKLDPTITCPAPVGPIYCYNSEIAYMPVAEDNCGIDTILVTNLSDIANPCGPDGFGDEVLRRVTRSYRAVDNVGRESETCVVTFDILRIPAFSILGRPDNLLVSSENNLECDQPYAKLPNGHPSPTAPTADGTGGTGAPTLEINGEVVNLFDNPENMCNLVVDFVDNPLDPINGVQKIMRTWTIYEWSCDSRDTSYLQMIEIADTEGPTFTCPGDMTVSTNNSSCQASVLLPSVSPVDNCNNATFTYSINLLDDNDEIISGLNTNGGLAQFEVGSTTVRYIVFDIGGNSSDTCTFEVAVADQTPPVVICKLHTTVSLTNNGLAQVPASVFDNGSYDECAFDRIEVRRMTTTCDGFPLEAGDDPATPGFDDLFFDNIHFCCEDVSSTDPVMVVLRAYDVAGNFNDCMVEVFVQDKIAPSIICPADMEFTCDFAFDRDNLDAFFGTATVTGGCADAPVRSVANFDSLNTCNIGFITRTFTATNAGGTTSCTQRIDFDPVDELFNEDLIEWPADTLFTGCALPGDAMFDPSNTGEPIFQGAFCAQVGFNFTDEVFTFNNNIGDACFKIVRTFTVIDWCQFTTVNGLTVYPEWNYTQIIKVNDDIAPTITTSCDRIEVCTFDNLCQTGVVELTNSATDNCTETLRYTFQVDIDNDKVFDAEFGGTGLANTAVATNTFPVGNHRIVWSWEDRCGNVTACEQLFDVVNCKAPTPYCLDGLALALMPVDEDGDGTVDFGMIETWASDFDAGSFHPCGYEVFFSFEEVTELNADGTPNVTFGMEFDCDSQGEQEVDVYTVVVTPLGTILQDFCTATIDIQDNQNSCDDDDDDNNRVVVEGNITTAYDAMLEDVSVELQGSELPNDMTDVDGAYAFPSMETGGSYVVNPAKDDDIKNGVNTLDLVFIQRHILTIELLDSPYKMIAADVNSDEAIMASDLLALRKLILGVETGLPNTQSWKFIDAAYQFPDVTDPFATNYPQDYSINPLSSDMEVNFVAVKMGDVNQDANLTSDEEVEGRSANTVNLIAENATFEAGETVLVPLTLKDAASLIGMQFTFDVDASVLDIVDMESDVISLDENNLGYAYANAGNVAFSWNDVKSIDIEANEVIATLVLQAKSAGQLGNALTISDAVTKAEAYDGNLDRMNVEFTIEGRESSSNRFDVYQNRPNPFNDVTSIRIELPVASDVQFAIYDIAGKRVQGYTRSFEAGTHNILVDKNDINGSGIYYYQIKAGEYAATKKMILID